MGQFFNPDLNDCTGKTSLSVRRVKFKTALEVNVFQDGAIGHHMPVAHSQEEDSDD